MKLSGQQFERLSNALLDAFDRSDLEMLLKFSLDVRLGDVARRDSTMRGVVYDILTRAELEGWTPQLLRAIHKARPRNQTIDRVYGELSGSAEPVVPAGGKIESALFMPQEVLKIHELLLRTNLADEDSVAALTGGMNTSIQASLPTADAPHVRLLLLLQALNQIGELGTGEVPFETFLLTAAQLTRGRPESAELNRFARAIRQRYPALARTAGE